MDYPLTDRRLDARFGQSAIAGAQAILRPGYAVSLVNLSCGGALIEGPRPLRPGARVHVQLVTGDRRLGIGAQVLRCAVAALDSRRGVRYRGALKFDHRFEALWEAATLEGYRLPGEEPALGRAAGHTLPERQEDADARSHRNPE
jgi:hypothetical protein